MQPTKSRSDEQDCPEFRDLLMLSLRCGRGVSREVSGVQLDTSGDQVGAGSRCEDTPGAGGTAGGPCQIQAPQVTCVGAMKPGRVGRVFWLAEAARTSCVPLLTGPYDL